MRRYTDEEKQAAVELYFREHLTTQGVVDRLGYPTRQNLERWLSKDVRYGSNFRRGFYPVDLKVRAVEMYLTGNHTGQEVVDHFQLSCYGTLMHWVSVVRRLGYDGLIPRKKNAAMPNPEPPKVPDDLETLKKRCEALELDNAILRETIGILKKDPSVDPRELSNREKTQVIGALKTVFPLHQLMKTLRIARSSYYYHVSQMRRKDVYAEIRPRIQALFDLGRHTYGYRRIWSCLRSEGIRISEKVVRRLMMELGLQVIVKRRRRYSNYLGEITPAPENMINRDFHAAKPNEKWLTDITEMAAADGKVYLSPIIDCFDGAVVTWKLSRKPNAHLTNGMLRNAIQHLKPGVKPVIHTDRGAHYRWPSWIQLVEGAGLSRSMSRKACTPDNAACEGFFGRLKNEMYFGYEWHKKPASQLIKAIDDYIRWYNTKRIKMSLGGKSPQQFRLDLGFAWN